MPARESFPQKKNAGKDTAGRDDAGSGDKNSEEKNDTDGSKKSGDENIVVTGDPLVIMISYAQYRIIYAVQ